MDEAKIKEVFSDAQFVKGLFELDTPEQVQAALRTRGVEMSDAEIMDIRSGIIKAAEKADKEGELSLDQLDEAAGGVVISAVAIPTIITAVVTAGAVFGTGAVAATAMGVTGAATVGTAAAIGAIGNLISNRRW